MRRDWPQKIVRANIPSIIIKNGEIPKYEMVKLDTKKALELMVDKLIEEAEEVRKAKNQKELMEEMVDVYQVFRDMMRMLGMSLPTLEKPRQEKELIVGSFINNGELTFLEYVDIPEKSDIEESENSK